MSQRSWKIAFTALLLLLAPISEVYALSEANPEKGPLPKLLRGNGHVHPETGQSRDGADKMLTCLDSPIYTEYVYFSDATHTTVVGWKIWDCQGKFHRSGTTSAYCDWYRECCLSGANEQGTCE